jgi:hypothetical protein
VIAAKLGAPRRADWQFNCRAAPLVRADALPDTLRGEHATYISVEHHTSVRRSAHSSYDEILRLIA